MAYLVSLLAGNTLNEWRHVTATMSLPPPYCHGLAGGLHEIHVVVATNDNSSHWRS